MLRRATRVKLLLVLVASLSLCFAEELPAADVVPIKVMTFNIRYGTAKDGENHWKKRKDFLVETIEKFDPDLLGTQETLAFQRDYLLPKLPNREQFSVGRDDGSEKGEMAAIFYRKDRFEKLDGGHFWLSETPDKAGSKSWDSSLPRIVTWLKLKDRRHPDKPPIVYFNTHFDHQGVEARKNSALLLRRRIDALPKNAPTVVTGDFNCPEGSAPYLALFASGDGKPASVVDAFRIAHPKQGSDEGTFSAFRPGARPGRRIDWIGCSKEFEVISCEIDRTERDGRTPSDHFPVKAVLRYSAAGAKSSK